MQAHLVPPHGMDDTLCLRHPVNAAKSHQILRALELIIEKCVFVSDVSIAGLRPFAQLICSGAKYISLQLCEDLLPLLGHGDEACLAIREQVVKILQKICNVAPFALPKLIPVDRARSKSL